MRRTSEGKALRIILGPLLAFGLFLGVAEVLAQAQGRSLVKILEFTAVAVDPAVGSSVAGQVFYNSTTGKLKIFHGGIWNDVSGAGGASGYNAQIDGVLAGTATALNIQQTSNILSSSFAGGVHTLVGGSGVFLKDGSRVATGPFDLNANEIKNFRAHNFTTVIPVTTAGNKGLLFFDANTGINLLKWSNGTVMVDPLDLSSGNHSGTLPVARLPSLVGDVTGAVSTNTVGKLQGRTVSAVAPVAGQVLFFNSGTTTWEGKTAAGDVTGDFTALNVGKLQGRAVSSSVPSAGHVLTFNGTTSTWEGQAVTATSLRGVNVSTVLPTTVGQVLKFDGTDWAPGTDNAGTGGGSTAFAGDMSTTTQGFLDNSVSTSFSGAVGVKDEQGLAIVNAAGTTGVTISAVAPGTIKATGAGMSGHTINLGFAAPVNIGTANSSGTSNDLSRSDHAHAHPVIASGDLHTEYLRADGTRGLSGNMSVGGNQLTNLKLENLATDPTLAVGSAGRIWLNTTGSKVKWAKSDTVIVDPLDRAVHTGTSAEVAGGDLSGTLSNATVATGAITSGKIADGTIADVDVATANKDGAAGVASLRTLGTGALQAAPGVHASAHKHGGADEVATVTPAGFAIPKARSEGTLAIGFLPVAPDGVSSNVSITRSDDIRLNKPISVKDEGTALAGSPYKTINLIGSGVTSATNGTDATVVDVTISGGASTGTSNNIRSLVTNLIINSPNGANPKSVSLTCDGITVFDSSLNKVYSTNNVSLSADADATGAGGLIVGPFTADTWYALYVWTKADPPLIADAANITLTIDPSFVSPTAPTGFVARSLVGAVRANSTATDWVRIAQYGDHAQYLDLPAMQDPPGALAFTAVVVPTIPPLVTRAITIFYGATIIADVGCSLASTASGKFTHSAYRAGGGGFIHGLSTNSILTFGPILESQTFYFKDTIADALDARFAFYTLGFYLSTITASGTGGSQASTPQMRGTFSRLKIVAPNGANPKSVSLTCDGIRVFDSTNNAVYETSNVSISADADLTGAGGLVVGSFTANTWYALYVWTKASPPLIANADVVLTIDPSFTVPTAPTGGFVAKKLVGAVRANSGATNFVASTQRGDKFLWSVSLPILDPPETGVLTSFLLTDIPPTITTSLIGTLGSPDSVPSNCTVEVASDSTGYNSVFVNHISGGFNVAGIGVTARDEFIVITSQTLFFRNVQADSTNRIAIRVLGALLDI